MDALHPNVPIEDDSDVESETESETESQISNRDQDMESNATEDFQENDEKDEENEEDGKSTSEASENIEDLDDEDSSDNESLTGSDYWENMICTAAESVDHDEPEDLLHEPQLSEMVNVIRKIVLKNIKFANYMENEDGIVDQIGKAVERHENDGADKDAAEEAGWLDKRVLIKREIKKLLGELDCSSDEDDDTAEKEEDDKLDDEMNAIEPYQF